MKGGKSISEGYKGRTFDVYNENDDDNENQKDYNNFYSKFSNENPNEIVLYSLNKTITIKDSNNKEKEQILSLLKHKTNFIIKEFKRGNLILGNGRYNFRNELKSIKKLATIYKDKLSHYTTIKPIFKYNNIDVYAMSYDWKFYIFQEKCYKTLDNIDFTQNEFDKMIKDIYESLLILQKNSYLHNDIKFDNIIYCDNKYKIIDWDISISGYSHNKSILRGNAGNFTFNHPIKFYNLGTTIFIYNFAYLIFKSLQKKSDKWIYNLESFKLIEKKAQESANILIETNKYKNLTKHYDMYSFAILIMCLAEKNNLTYSKEFINKLFAPFKITI